MSQPIVKSLTVYPLKSAAGIAINEMPIVSSGPQHDREWMVVDGNNNFVSQRTHPKMGQIQTQLTKDHLILNVPGMSALKIPKIHGNPETETVKIFGKETLANTVGETFDQWLSDYLGAKVRLVRSPSKPSRETSGNHGPKTEVLFPDGYPFLLTNDATLTELNKKLAKTILMNRFRPNIVIEGAPADAEDSWSSFMINGVPFLSVKACSRCSIINLDQETGTKNSDVTKTLKTYRTKDGHVVFGRNLSHQAEGVIRVGDPLDSIQ